MTQRKPQNNTPHSSGPVVVIGSINMDLVCRTLRMPLPGQTLLGSDLVTISGGKGANQAVAAARLGARVHMVGRVGDDDFGQRLLTGLRRHNVNTDHITITEGISSGAAMILVDKKGENSIVVAPGANARLSPGDIDAARPLIASAAVVVMQLETPLRTIRHAIAMCQKLKIPVILDPAPMPPRGLPRAFLGVDLLTPNQHEAMMLLGAGRTLHPSKISDPKQIAGDLLLLGAQLVVLKLGGRGSMIVDHTGRIERIRPYKIKVVDTTAAGDAFTGALAVGWAEGMDLIRSVRFANAAGALCCTVFGAQPALPNRAAVDHLLRKAN